MGESPPVPSQHVKADKAIVQATAQTFSSDRKEGGESEANGLQAESAAAEAEANANS